MGGGVALADNSSLSAMDFSIPGMVFATTEEIQAGTDTTKTMHPAGLKGELDRRGPIDAYAAL